LRGESGLIFFDKYYKSFKQKEIIMAALKEILKEVMSLSPAQKGIVEW
jgi:hypothetical protein